MACLLQENAVKCRSCGRTQIKSYTYNAYKPSLNEGIITLTREGLQIAKNICLPAIVKGKTYEVDEVRTFVKRKDKLIWIVCALERTSKGIVSFNIGPRTH